MAEYTVLLGMADALMVNLDVKAGIITQRRVPVFNVMDTPLEYRLRLLVGYCSPDYSTATLVFHLAGNAYLLAEQDNKNLTFSLLNIPTEDGWVLDGIESVISDKTSLSLRLACKPYKVRVLGTRVT